MTDAQRAAFEAMGATVELAMEGDDWRSWSVQGDGFHIYVPDDAQSVQAMLDAMTAREEGSA